MTCIKVESSLCFVINFIFLRFLKRLKRSPYRFILLSVCPVDLQLFNLTQSENLYVSQMSANAKASVLNSKLVISVDETDPHLAAFFYHLKYTFKQNLLHSIFGQLNLFHNFTNRP